MRSCVLLADDAALGTPAVAQGFARWRGTPAFDGARAARSGWGILGENLQPEEAQACAAAFESCGIATKTLAMPSPPALPAPLTVRSVSAMTESALDLVTDTGRQGAVRFDELAFVATAVLVERSMRKEETTQGPSLGGKLVRTGITLATGIPVGGGKTTVVERAVEERNEVLRCDLYLQGVGRRLRFDVKTLNFTFLGADKTFSLISNYRAFIRRIVERAPAARLNAEASLLLSGGANVKAGYEGEADFERECRWRCSLLGLTAPERNSR